MKKDLSRKSKVTAEHEEEARLLKAIWDRTAHDGQAVFGERYEIGNQSAVGQFLRGITPLSLKAAAGFARGLGCAVGDFSPRLAAQAAELTRGLDAEKAPPQVMAEPYAGEEDHEEAGALTIPQFDTGGAMGHGVTLHDQPGVIRRWVVSADWIHHNVHRITSPKNLVIVTGFGDSMRPLYNPGDPLLVDRGINRADIDGIYFFRVNGEGFVKRLQRIPTIGGVIIRATSENPRYDAFEIVKGMDFEIFGRVVKAWRSEDF